MNVAIAVLCWVYTAMMVTSAIAGKFIHGLDTLAIPIGATFCTSAQA